MEQSIVDHFRSGGAGLGKFLIVSGPLTVDRRILRLHQALGCDDQAAVEKAVSSWMKGRHPHHGSAIHSRQRPATWGAPGPRRRKAARRPRRGGRQQRGEPRGRVAGRRRVARGGVGRQQRGEPRGRVAGGRRVARGGAGRQQRGELRGRVAGGRRVAHGGVGRQQLELRRSLLLEAGSVR